MSKTAIISDIHSNLHALTAVIEDMNQQQGSDIICLGDMVGYNAYPSECLDYIRLNGYPVVRGNHDEALLKEDPTNMNPIALQALQWTRSQLTQEQLDWISSLQYMRLMRSAFTIVHATIDQPKAWNYIINSSDAASNLSRQFSPISFHGHTHVPRIFICDGQKTYEDSESIARLDQDGEAIIQPIPGYKYLINVGSVGQPRDYDSRSCYALFDNDTKQITLRKVVYDINAAQQAILAAGLPEFLAARLASGI